MPGSSPGKTSVFVSMSYFQMHVRIPAAQCARVMHEFFAPEKQRAWGMPGARCTRSLVCSVGWWHTSVVTTVAPGSPGIPARNGFNGFLRALPGDRAFLSPSLADMACLRPVGPTCLRKLDASVGASGPHDFAVRFSAVRQHAVRSLTGESPPCHPVACPTLPRPPHPIPRP